MKKIIQKDNKVLRQVAKEVKISEITSPNIQKIIKEMSESLAKEYDGVALAAPQIAYSLAIFIVSGKIFDPDFLRGGVESPKRKIDDLVFINPKILKLSKVQEDAHEGCLSVRPLYGTVKRSKKATIQAYDKNGKKFKMEASGLLAQIFQHECDHLKGILFIDKAEDLHELNY